MGSIEGVIILSSTNEPILHSHFTHPQPNYPILHADQLAAKIEAASVKNSDILPISFADGIAHLSMHVDDEVEDEEEKGSTSLEIEDESGVAAIESIESHQTGSALVHIQHNQIRLAATFSKHVDPLFPIAFLDNLLTVLALYLGNPITEDAIRDNYDIVYQILEEMLDESGQPLNTEYNTLRDLVREPSWVNNVMGKMSSMPGLSTSAASSAHISNIPWRRSIQSTPRTTRHELYVDIIDVVKGTFSGGSLPNALPNLQVQGLIECNCRLGATPDLILSLSNAALIDSPSLHPCVRVKRWKKDKVFSFVPPDGRFILAEYDLEQPDRLEKSIPLSLKCSRQDKSSKDTLTFRIELIAHSLVENIEISFDVKEKSSTVETTLAGGSPTGGSNMGIPTEDLNALKGTVSHDPKSGLVRWTIDKMEAHQKPLILSGNIRSDLPPKISSAVVSTFTVPTRTLSGLKVTSLEIINDVGYRPFKGVRNVVRGDLDWRW